MRGVVYASVTLALAATMPHPVAAQCYGPECGRDRSGPPASFNQPPTQYQNPAYQNPGNGQPYQSAPPSPYQQGRSYDQARPQLMPYSQQNYQQPQQSYQQPDFQRPDSQRPDFQRPDFQRPGYQAQPRSPNGYGDMPPGVAPPHGYRQARPDGRMIDPRTQFTRPPKVSRHVVRHQPAVKNRQVARDVSRDVSNTAGAGRITISMAEYRDLQNQARELQRLMSQRGGAPDRRNAPGRRNVFPDIPPPGAGGPPPGAPPRS